MGKTVAIVGGGVIGGGWAARFALNGWDVRVFDPDPEAERKIGEVLDNARASLPGLGNVALPTEGPITFHASLAEAVEGCSLGAGKRARAAGTEAEGLCRADGPHRRGDHRRLFDQRVQTQRIAGQASRGLNRSW